MTEISLEVAGVGRLGKCRRMAGVAISVLQLVIAIRMTLSTLQGHVRARECELRRGMTECGRFPDGGAVAVRA